MKKIVVFTVMLAMGFSVVACGDPNKYHRIPEEYDVHVKEINVITIEEETVLTEQILYENVITEDIG